jgi:AcrR family transcriptional regulator
MELDDMIENKSDDLKGKVQERMTAPAAPASDKLTQADRRTRTRNALLDATARGLSRHGYGNLVLERVASEAGYSRGALYHLFSDKEELTLAVVQWVGETWHDEVGHLFVDEPDPVEALLAVARESAIYSRRDVARVLRNLKAEFDGRDHPIGEAVHQAERRVVEDCARLITAGRQTGRIPPGPPPAALARAYLGAIEGVAISLAGQEPYDVVLAEQAARGILDLT